jgi:hypothetical protein
MVFWARGGGPRGLTRIEGLETWLGWEEERMEGTNIDTGNHPFFFVLGFMFMLRCKSTAGSKC